MGEEPIFNVFTHVVDTYHQPIVLPIAFDADIEARQGRFSVPGVIEAEGRPILNVRLGVSVPSAATNRAGRIAAGEGASGRAATAPS